MSFLTDLIKNRKMIPGAYLGTTRLMPSANTAALATATPVPFDTIRTNYLETVRQADLPATPNIWIPNCARSCIITGKLNTKAGESNLGTYRAAQIYFGTGDRTGTFDSAVLPQSDEAAFRTPVVAGYASSYVLTVQSGRWPLDEVVGGKTANDNGSGDGYGGNFSIQFLHDAGVGIVLSRSSFLNIDWFS